MKRLIKADLAGVLNMVPTYFPVPEACVKMEIARLSREEQADFLFLARREKCWLFDIPSVYTRTVTQISPGPMPNTSPNSLLRSSTSMWIKSWRDGPGGASPCWTSR